MSRPIITGLRVAAVYCEVLENPGIYPSALARRLRVDVQAVNRCLTHLEARGLRLCEGERNRLYVYDGRAATNEARP